MSGPAGGYIKQEARVPLSILDGSDGEMVVSFDWAPGTAPTGISGPPENYDPGEGDEIVITAVHYDSAPGIPVLLAEHEDEAVVNWLYDNWERPAEDDGTDPDWLREMQYDDRLLQEAEAQAQFTKGDDIDG